MFSSDMLANIIRYYGHSMQGLMGSYLERSIGAFHEAQRKFQEQTQSLYGSLGTGIPQNLANLGNLGNLTKTVPALNPEAWTKLLQGGAPGVPGMMGEYLEKSASNVIGMQEELRKQAMQMFSTFPYNPVTGNGADEKAAAASESKPARAKPKAKKTGRS